MLLPRTIIVSLVLSLSGSLAFYLASKANERRGEEAVAPELEGASFNEPAQLAVAEVRVQEPVAALSVEAAVRGVEPVDPNPQGWPESVVDEFKAAHPNQIEAIEHIVRATTFEAFAALSAEAADDLLAYAASVRLEMTRAIPHLCWHLSTEVEVETAFEDVRALALSEGSRGDSATALPIFQGDGRWSFTATDGATGPAGTAVTIRWSFVPDGTLIDNSRGQTLPNELIEKLNDTYGASPVLGDLTQAPWFEIFENAFAAWAEITGNTYIYEPNDDGAVFPASGVSGGAPGSSGVRGDVRISGVLIDGNSNTLAFNFFPNVGDMVIDTADASNFGNTAAGRARLFNTVAHEHGHGLGLSHVCPRNFTKLMEPTLTTAFSGPQLDDLITAQGLYGDPFEVQGNNERNDSVSTAYDLGLLNAGFSANEISISNSTDRDFFRFRLNAPRGLNLTVTPEGSAPFREGSQVNGGACAAASTFPFYDPETRQNLMLRVIAPDGSTIASSDAGAIGQPESLAAIQLTAVGQDYTIEVTGGGENAASGNNAQLYGLDLELIDPSAILIDGFTIIEEDCVPGNGAPDPDEVITASVVVSNVGSEVATGTTVTLSGSTSLSITGTAVQNVGTLSPGDSVTLNYTFSLSGDCLDTVSIQFRATTNSGFVDLNKELTLGLVDALLSENFDTTTVGQIPPSYSQSSASSLADWRTISTSSSSSPNSIHSPGADFGANSAFLMSPILPEITVDSELLFDHSYRLIAAFNNSARFNGGVLEISINDGPWIDWVAAGGVFTQNGYNSSIFDVTPDSPLDLRNAWTGDSSGFITTIARFPALAIGQSARVRWHHGTITDNVTGGGWTLDNIVFRGPVCCASIVPTLNVAAVDGVAQELDTSDAAQFAITSDLNVDEDLTVAYTLSGDAISGSDFVALAGSATILSGEASALVPVTAITDDVVEGDETLTLTLSSSVDYELDVATASITIRDLPFDTYRSINFGSSVTRVAEDEDFDLDGLLNLIEYAFRLDPTAPGVLPFSLLVQNSGAPTLELTYYEDTRLDDVAYIVETSSTLEADSWTTVGVSITSGSLVDGLQFKTARIAVGAAPGFIRIRVERSLP